MYVHVCLSVFLSFHLPICLTLCLYLVYQRAYNTFGLRVTDVKCQHHSKQQPCYPSCQVEAVNYMADFFPFPKHLTHFTYFVNARQAFPDLVNRLNKRWRLPSNSHMQVSKYSSLPSTNDGMSDIAAAGGAEVGTNESVEAAGGRCGVDPAGNLAFDMDCIL